MGIDVIESLILVNKVEFALVFVETIEEFESQIITLLPKLKDDVILWLHIPVQFLKIFDRYNRQLSLAPTH